MRTRIALPPPWTRPARSRPQRRSARSLWPRARSCVTRTGLIARTTSGRRRSGSRWMRARSASGARRQDSSELPSPALSWVRRSFESAVSDRNGTPVRTKFEPPFGIGAPISEGDGAPRRIRTCDPRVRSPILYPAELEAPALIMPWMMPARPLFLPGGHVAIRIAVRASAAGHGFEPSEFVNVSNLYLNAL